MEPVKNKANRIINSQKCSKVTIVLMSRWHGFNRCKSRLSKDLGPVKAAKIQEKLTLHTIAVAKRIKNENLAEVKIAIDGVGIKAAKRWASLYGIERVVSQGAGNLGTKMRRQFLKTHSEKYSSCKISNSIIIIGTDLPSISHLDLIQAIEILNYKEMVLGPSTDGGYWLIGLSKKLLNPLCSWPFSGIRWGTDEVFLKTIELASLNQVNYQLLQKKNDLDSLIDLSPWLDYKNFQISASSFQL